MKTKIKYFIGLILLCSAVIFSYGCKSNVITEGIAPDFTLHDLEGEPVSLKHYLGNIVLLDFWATWCPPCKVSIPELVDLQKRYKDRDLVVLGVSVDDPRQTDNDSLKVFKRKFRINYKILRSNDRMLGEYFGTQQFSIPTMFIIDRDGKIADKLVGFQAGALERSLKKLIP